LNFAWSDYLHLARQLLQESESAASEEANLRTAISRAYYAAFCSARNHLRDKEGQSMPGGGSVHTYVREQFQKGPGETRKVVGRSLGDLRFRRNQADYDDGFAQLRTAAEASLAQAAEVIAILASLK
jgi:uncharacterized protein (UPF0332 family)